MPSVDVTWLEGLPNHAFGATFGLPWHQGQLNPSQTNFSCLDNNGVDVPIQTRILAYWQDGSIKWTSHAIAGSAKPQDGYNIQANTVVQCNASLSHETKGSPQLIVSQDHLKSVIRVQTGRIEVLFPISGSTIIQSIKSIGGKVTGANGRLVLLSQSDPIMQSISNQHEFKSQIDEVVIEQSGPIRAVIAVKGKHHSNTENDDSHIPWLPFVLRFYLYANSSCIRMMHTIVYDGDMNKDFIRGIGVRFDIPLQAERLFDRHVRISGVSGGVLSEAIQGVTGLRRDPGIEVRDAQFRGRPTPSLETWESSVSSRLQWVPSWNDFSLTQLSADGFTVRKRTRSTCSWVNIPGGTRSDGLIYLGGATAGGLAVGLKDFWERYPTGLNIRNAVTNAGEITVWLYSPSSEPLDMRQYHDGLNQKTYDEQLDALNITYEDWESGTGTPYGIARTNEIYIFSLDETPDQKMFSTLAQYIRAPPILLPTSETIYQTKALGSNWCPTTYLNSLCPKSSTILTNLEFLFRFYKSQVSQRRWYGFWDYGDIMHAYDNDRHTWRYDVGGYAWDNSELSPDLWLWLYFLQTGRADVYRMAEALTRHTGEVDVYHIGAHKGLGTRHGVQHWSDSCKQARISNALYRKYFYYLSGGDERVGDLLQEVLDTDTTFLVLDPYRKVRKDKETYKADSTRLSLSLGTDWAAMASAWSIEVERRGSRWKEAEKKLLASIEGIGNLANGFVTAIASYNIQNGSISPPAQDPLNKGVVQISHLSAMFGLFEVCADIIDCFPSPVTSKFEHAWLEYCRYFNGTSEEQISRFGLPFGKLQLRQGHSRLTAYAAARLGDKTLAKRAWEQFYLEDRYGPEDGYGIDTPWVSNPVDTEKALVRLDEANWVSTNITALYGIAAIQNLALIGEDNSN
ncbi:hypothetical protein G7Y89_g11543 [Cudoniella acicularis]|uniref:Tat pathway signal sequence domain protein n=1 Tax=Cudoniella acicularis TaxID=354080 RepID=A0A8H4RDI2_9HELO|nr:hypothetical protein G7Y89_g11543 [Cudoniella acicularis]